MNVLMLVHFPTWVIKEQAVFLLRLINYLYIKLDYNQQLCASLFMSQSDLKMLKPLICQDLSEVNCPCNRSASKNLEEVVKLLAKVLNRNCHGTQGDGFSLAGFLVHPREAR